MKNVRGEPLAPESVRMLEYLRERAAALGLAEIRGRVRAAMKEMDAAVAGLGEADAGADPVGRGTSPSAERATAPRPTRLRRDHIGRGDVGALVRVARRPPRGKRGNGRRHRGGH